MKIKLLSSVFLFLFIFSNSYSQWKPVKSLQGGNGAGIIKDDNSLYLMVAGFGFMRSTDNGNTWQRLLKQNFFYGVYRFSASENLLTVDSLLSIDTGQTWQALVLPFLNNGNRELLAFDGKLFCSGSQGIACSNDSGITWTIQQLSPQGPYKFLKSDSKLYVVNYSTIYRTNDSGLTWDSICPNPFGTIILTEGIIEKGDTLFYKASGGWGIYRTIDHGNNWLLMNNLNDVSEMFFENDTLYFTTLHYEVAISTDLGNTFSIIGQKPGLAGSFFKDGTELMMSGGLWGMIKFNLNSLLFTQHVKGIYGVPVVALEIHQDSIYVLSNRILYYSFDKGNSWFHTDVYSIYTSNSMAVFNRSVYALEGFKIYKFNLDSLTWQFFGYTSHYYQEIHADTSGIYCSGWQATGNQIIRFPLQGGAYSVYSSAPPVQHSTINNGNIYAGGGSGLFKSSLTTVPLWMHIDSGLNYNSLGGPHSYAFNGSKIYLGGWRGIYRAQAPDYIWTFTGLLKQNLFDMITYGDAVIAATEKKGICILRSDTTNWDPINFRLPKNDLDSDHLYGFGAIAASDSLIYAGAPGYVHQMCGLWYIPVSELNIPVATAVEENNQTANVLDIIPNPSSDKINISFPVSSSQHITTKIFSVTGEVVFKEENKAGVNYFSETINIKIFQTAFIF